MMKPLSRQYTKQYDEAAVAAFWSDIKNTKCHLHRLDEIHHTLGDETWRWPVFMETKSKPMSQNRFDPQNKYLIGGAHMPLITFVGGSCNSNRSAEKHRERAAKRRQKQLQSGIDHASTQKQKMKQRPPKGIGKGKPTVVGDHQAGHECEEPQ